MNKVKRHAVKRYTATQLRKQRVVFLILGFMLYGGIDLGLSFIEDYRQAKAFEHLYLIELQNDR